MFEISMQGISIGPLEIRFYSLMILSGIGVGVVIAQREAKRYGEDPTHVINITVIGAILAIVGARAYHVLDRDQWPYYAANPGDIIKVWNGGIGIFGAIAGAAIGLIIYVWWVNSSGRARDGRRAQRIGVLRWLDIGAPAFLIGQAVGRWGNFFNEELFGPPTDLPWGIPIDLINRPPEYIASPGTYDHKHVFNIGHVDQCIAYGPGLLHLAHQPDEYCEIDHLIQSCKVMALTAMRLLGTL